MSYSIVIAEQAQAQIRKLPAKVVARIDRKVQSLSQEPRGSGSVKLTGYDYYRVRVGDYRIIYSINDAEKIVSVLIAAHRRESYRGL